ncbi:Glucosidase 2 subunit beta [Erysiphe neolycopersici]|uniref:Glucosidase 2 subunit beta n=1 Tax=Erysiphe neolycopersici TaxID=212602 RepID=A0A420HB92_9PEZI|nr:Glucosidase 2 subunit beta [Erysiphe neolycopersici]
MRPYNQLALFVYFPFLFIAAGAKRPRGVGPEYAKFYQSEIEFQCIFNPSITLKPSQINDDYCDCPDGSDEPGTAACSVISLLSSQLPLKSDSHNTSLAIPGFYCKNRDYIPTYLPLSNVNDGVCEYDLCCDGSDEWAGVGGIRCDNKCGEMGNEWKRQQEIKENLLRNALQKRVQLVTKAKALRSEVEIKIKDLERETIDLEHKVTDLKKKYDEVKRKERGRMVKSGSSGKGGRIAILANLIKIRIDQLRKALSQQVSKNEALQKKADSLEKILSAFKEDYNPNFNDEGVKRAVKAWEEYAAKKDADITEDEDLDIDGILKEDDEENGINWSEWQDDGNSDNSVLYKFEEYLPTPIRTWIDSKLVDLRIYLIDNGFLPSTTTEEVETKELREAREAYESITNEINLKKSDKDQKQADLSKDYGKDEVFRALEGHCLEKDSGEYTYELCWLKETKQKSKKNGVEIRMGTFTSFDRAKVETSGIESIENGQVSFGLISGPDVVNERLTLKYENGQNCWNGPSRETLVVLSCADENIIWKINEFEKCKYRMDVGSPAVCEISSKKKN